MKKILFINSMRSQCGVFEYGDMTHKILRLIDPYDYQFTYLQMADYSLSHDHVKEDYDAVIVNYHPITIKNFHFDKNVKYFCILHDQDLELGSHINYIHPNPAFVEHDNHFKVGRFLPKCPAVDALPKTYYLNRVGTFGFGMFNKNYEKICDLLNNSLDHGQFLLHIPNNTHIDSEGKVGDHVIIQTKRALKPSIELIVNREYLPIQQLISLFSQNVLNIFYYDPNRPSTGCSSAADIALATKRPIALNDCVMFRHILEKTDRCNLDKYSVNEIIKFGNCHLDYFYENWTEENLRKDYKRIFDVVL